jgi:AraC family transcriptional regulator
LTQASNEYIKRIDRVIDHLRSHLDQSFKLEELARIACFSDFHFHRIFGAMIGETLNSFTNRLRLEKAARLLRRSSQSATDVALECGFSSSATFSRAFSKAYNVSPSEYRKTGKFKNSKICKELFPKHEYVLPMTEKEKEAAFPIEIKKFPAWDVAYIRVSNSFEGDRVLQAFRKIIAWAKSQKIYDKGTLFGMSIDDPSVTPKHLYRYEACFASSSPFDCTEDISKTKIPSRAYAVTRIHGDIRRSATAWDYLSGDWLIKSDYEPEHAPGFEIILNKEEAEIGLAVTATTLSLDWSKFELDLCLPIKPINRN